MFVRIETGISNRNRPDGNALNQKILTVCAKCESINWTKATTQRWESGGLK